MFIWAIFNPDKSQREAIHLIFYLRCCKVCLLCGSRNAAIHHPKIFPKPHIQCPLHACNRCVNQSLHSKFTSLRKLKAQSKPQIALCFARVPTAKQCCNKVNKIFPNFDVNKLFTPLQQSRSETIRPGSVPFR